MPFFRSRHSPGLAGRLTEKDWVLSTLASSCLCVCFLYVVVVVVCVCMPVVCLCVCLW